jgi:superfamily II DNA/RNA helicase
MKSSFKNLGISPPILKAIEEMGFETPTDVQSKAIPHILNKEDLIVMSKTGSGKTAVFGVSMLQMIDPGAAGPQCLILTPTRELAVQVDSDLKQMSKHLQHKTTAIYGQHNMNIEIQTLNEGVSIVTGTPGRVYDHIRHGNLVTKHIRFLALDEADRMLDMGFLDQVVRIIKTLPKDRVTLLFSATIPAEIHKICSEYMRHPVTIEIESQTKTVATTQQVYYRVDNKEKNIKLNRLLLVEQPESCMIFCNTRITVDRVQSFLSRKGYACQSLHGDIPQIRRLKTLQQFKQREFHLLVATDVAARGIHIDDLSLVINYDVPIEKDSYVHRIGRTGRAGNGGRAITLVTSEDIMSLYEIEEHIGAMIAEAEWPSEAVLNEHRASVDKWIQANSQKINSPRAASESNLRETQNKRSQTKPPQHHEKHRDQPIKVNTDYKTARMVNTVHPAEQPKPVHAITITVPHRSTEADSVHAKLSVEIVQSQISTTKKPLLQRILQRILGR